jgi:hypothetical protein
MIGERVDNLSASARADMEQGILWRSIDVVV